VRQGSQAGYKMFCTNGIVVTETLERKKEKNTKKERGTQPKWFSMQSWPLLVRSWSLTLQTKNSSSFFLFFDFTGYPQCVSTQFFLFSIRIRLGKNQNDPPAIWRSIWIGAAEFICCFHVTGENFRFAVNRHLLV
jgi:hypothetical protein